MKLAILFAILAIFTLPAFAQSSEYVPGYVDKNGKYHEGYYRTKPNQTQKDNYGTKGNTNPYTGKEGTKTPKK